MNLKQAMAHGVVVDKVIINIIIILLIRFISFFPPFIPDAQGVRVPDDLNSSVEPGRSTNLLLCAQSYAYDVEQEITIRAKGVMRHIVGVMRILN